MGISPSPYQMVGKKERDSTQPCVLSSIVQSVGSRPCGTPSRIGTVSNKEKEMREILFRAKERYSGVWVEGALLKDNVFTYILSGNPKVNVGLHVTTEVAEVLPKTVGQFTGLTDKNGKMIFEGDIISTDIARGFLVVEFKGGAFVFNCNDGEDDYYDHINCSHELDNEYKYGEIIGNIHDNPELLEGGTC